MSIFSLGKREGLIAFLVWTELIIYISGLTFTGINYIRSNQGCSPLIPQNDSAVMVRWVTRAEDGALVTCPYVINLTLVI